VLSQLDGRIELILDGGTTPTGVASTVVDCSGERLVIVREGAIPREALLEAAAA
jgi:L-threonylcarbamoyladenylate synthase